MKSAAKKTKTTMLVIMLLLLPVVSMAGNLEPTSSPGSTMHTLEDIYNKLAILDAFTKTPDQVCEGKTFFGLNDDGIIGEMVGTTRFWDNGDGTVTDCTTDLIWLKDADCFGTQVWDDAMASAAELNSDECGLTDGSSEGDWHLASRDELTQIVGGLIPGTPFENVQSNIYWSDYWSDNDNSWCVNMFNGTLFIHPNSTSHYVWPVRSGN